MTKKDFELIAGVIAALTDDDGCMNSAEAYALRKDVARMFADALAPTNAQFKRNLFIQAATGVDAEGRDSDGYAERCRILAALHENLVT